MIVGFFFKLKIMHMIIILSEIVCEGGLKKITMHKFDPIIADLNVMPSYNNIYPVHLNYLPCRETSQSP